jgi:transposase
VLTTASRQLVWLLLKEPDVLDVDELTHVNLIVQASPVMKAAREFALEFQRCVRAWDVKKLETWFERVVVSEVQDFKSFVKGFDRDRAALFKALELPWSKRERPASDPCPPGAGSGSRRCRLVSKNGLVEVG